MLNGKTKYLTDDESRVGSFVHLSYTFDASLTALFMPLLSGKPIVIGSKDSTEVFKDPNFHKYAPYDFIKITPSHLEFLQPWMRTPDGVQVTGKLVIGGEALSAGQFASMTEEGMNVGIINEYGPTEASVGCTTFSFNTKDNDKSPDDGIPIGKPIDNVRIHILGSFNELLPLGATGEICIAGPGLARGYLNRQELTKEKFIKDPFGEGDRSRIYKTGDLGRRLHDGNIEFLGRKDEQVKIRGYRVEPGEAESILQQVELVSQGVVLAKTDSAGETKLISYYIPRREMVKTRERELYLSRVENWKELYENEYSFDDEEDIDDEFNLTGWNSSFTGEAIPADEMRQWVDDISEVILSEPAEKVLEIGCGTGLIYYSLAGKIKKYTGTDFSRATIGRLSERISKGTKNKTEAEFMVCAAHEISSPEGDKPDTIIMNSIVQYFPGEEYMNEVIKKCMSILKGKGRIVIGDVRDNRLLELFKSRLQIQNLARSVSIREFEWAVEQDVLKEEELCFSPEYFYKLRRQYPEITTIEIKWKRGSYINELTLYRYTVTVYVGTKKEFTDPGWLSWEGSNSKVTFIDQIEKNRDTIAIKNAPNPRLWKERLLRKALDERSAESTGDLLKMMQKEDEETSDIREILELAEAKGYDCTMFVSGDALKVNLLFERNLSDSFIIQPENEIVNSQYDLTNIPLFNDVSFSLQSDIRAELHERLPEYMIPSDMIALNHLPLTNNGKIDRKFLSQREDRSIVNKLNYQPPSNDTESKLVKIWQELLNLERVGTDDNFFEIGGHSLLGMRLISAIRREMETELAIKDLFIHPTIARLAEHLIKQSNGALLPAIEPGPRDENIPLSFSQERLWFIDRMEGSVQYHIPSVLRLKGELNIEALAFALKTIVDRHEVLRTVIREREGKAYQHIKPEDCWQLAVIDGELYQNDPDGLRSYIQQLINKPFDISKDNMLRAALIKLDGEQHILVVTMHHLVSDGWSTSILVREVVELYEAFAEGRTPKLLPLNIQYADYAMWQRKYLQGEVLDMKIGYWKNKLEGVSPLRLPSDFNRPAILGTDGANTGFSIDKEITGKLESLSREEGATMFMTLLAVFKLLLHHYSGQQDICVGTPIAGRQQHEVEGLIGFFVNTLALRSEVKGNASFKELLKQVKTTTLESYEHQEVPFEKVVEAVVKERDMSRSPLFQVMFALQNAPEVPRLRLGAVELSREGIAHHTSKFDFSFSITQTANGLHGAVEYSTSLYSAQTMGRMIGHFKELVSSVVNAPDHKISELSMLTQEEEHQLLSVFNDTASEYPKDKSIVKLFEDQVMKTPDNIAAAYGDEQLTYKELNERSNQLAHYLKSKGVKEESPVPVCMERSIDMITSMLGILKAGGAYVPVDPEYPAERIRFMFEDTGAPVILSSSKIGSKLPVSEEFEIIETDTESKTISSYPKDNIKSDIPSNHLAYVIYTSGSTGKPKGVMIEHSGVVNLVYWHNQVYHVTQKSRATTMAGTGFDAFGWEVWPYLLAGASVYIVDDETRLSPEALLNLFNSNEITHCFMPTALVSEFVNTSSGKVESLQYLLTGGDKLQGVQTEGNNFKLINNYGPTENTVVTTYYELPEKDAYLVPPIGKPVSNTIVRILDQYGRLVPVGAAGEICIGGDGLARGYLNLPELTKEKFIRDPFSKNPKSRLYRTGDSGRWLPDGNIEYLGRIDEQVKIRGYRIELGEIESVLQECGLVGQSVVEAKEDSHGNKRLVAYVVAEGDFEKDEMVSYLRSRLPSYMVPDLWVQLESLPLTSNGKIDRRALPEPDVTESLSNEYVAPRNELEEKLASTWKDLLNVNSVGIHDNFFELGGDSIITIQVLSRARRLGIELKTKDIFIYQTIGALSAALAERSASIVSGEQGMLTGPCKLLPIQQWFLDGNKGDISHFNQAVLLSIDKTITAEMLSDAVKQLMSQHDALRFSYHKKDGQWHQEYGASLDGAFAAVDLRSAAEGLLGTLIKEHADHYQRSLHIEKGEVAKFVLMQTPESETLNRIFIAIHHLAVDGVSWRILLDDLELLLTGLHKKGKADLGYKSSSYRQWYGALEEYGRSRGLLSQCRYWANAVSSYKPLYADRNHSVTVRSRDIENHMMRLDPVQTQMLIQEVPRVYHTEINDILLCALAMTFCEWGGTDKVIIGLEGHGRESISEHIDTSRTVGWFTNLYPLLLEVVPGTGVADAIKRVKEQLRKVPEKGIGYGVLKYINKEEALQGAEPWDIVFNYLGQLDNVVSSGNWLSGARESRGAGRSKDTEIREKLSVNGSIQGGELILGWSYSNLHYEKETIEELVEKFKSTLESLISHCVSQQKTGTVYTPSDYGLGSEVSYEELDQYLKVDDKDNIMSF